MLSLDNFDFELLGRAVFFIVTFAISLFITYGIYGGIIKLYHYINTLLQSKHNFNKSDITDDKDDFFFGAISDWRKMK